MAVFKKLVYDHTIVEQDTQPLILDDIQLHNDKTLQDYSTFGNSSTIHLTRHIRFTRELPTDEMVFLASVPTDLEVYNKAVGSTATRSGSPSPRKEYYQRQSRWTLGSEKDRISIPIHISESVHKDWIPFINEGITEINKACPGVHLFLDELSRSKVIIQGSVEEHCYTEGNIFITKGRKCTITFSHEWSNMKRTSVHELLHALGFVHEHQAADASGFLRNECPPDHKLHSQYAPRPDVCRLTPMDPFSILTYPEGCKGGYLFRKTDSDPVWNLKPAGEVNNEMSELDKVGLNLLFRPCRSAEYNPVRSPDTGMWYCGRPVMQDHNRPVASTTGHCGPNMGPNCPACRCLKNSEVDEFVSDGRWQGWSGLVYCGEYFGEQEPGHDGYCGPDQGLPCPECENILTKKDRH